jgi:hypothetical protein
LIEKRPDQARPSGGDVLELVDEDDPVVNPQENVSRKTALKTSVVDHAGVAESRR